MIEVRERLTIKSQPQNIAVVKGRWFKKGIYDSDRNIIYHPDSSVLLRNLSEVDYSENMRSLLENNQNSDVVSYKRGGANYYGGTRYIDAYSWTVLACMPGSEYMQETTIVFIMLVVGFLFCILITSLICFVRTRALLRPLKTIGVVAEEFAKGNLDSDIHRSTNDEIGDLEEVFSHTAGKGFAVVADEVRNLASKSAEASRTTQELIEASIEAVETGNELVTDAAKDLEKTAEEASKVMDSIAEIAQTSIEEAQAVHNVTMGLDQISSVVQTNAATAQESAASSEELSGQASMLQNLMAQFRLYEASSSSSGWEDMEEEPEEQIVSHSVFSDKY